MKRAMIMLIVLLLALASSAASAQDGKPTIAILIPGANSYPTQEGALLNMLQAYDFISVEEQAAAQGYRDLNGEKINIIWGAGNNDLADSNLMVETVIDQEPDLLVTFATSITQIAVNKTNDMDDPPMVIFAAVANPFRSGIAQSNCVKPAHVTGIQRNLDYEAIVEALLLQVPDLQTLGVIFGSADLVSVDGYERVQKAADARGISVTAAAAVDLSDLAVATDGLVSKGVDAIIVATSAMIAPGYGIIVETARDAAVPIVAPAVTSIFLGVTFGIGDYRIIQEGYDLGRLVVAWLMDEMDIATTGLHTIADVAMGMNLDSAELADIEVAEALVEQADAIVVGDHYQMAPKLLRDMFQNMPVTDELVLMMIQAANLPGVSVVDGKVQVPMSMMLDTAGSLASIPTIANPEADLALAKSLQCTDEMIAEQQAALDAAGG